MKGHIKKTFMNKSRRGSRHDSTFHGSRDKQPVSRHERSFHMNRDKMPMSRHEMGSHVNRNKRTMSRQDRSSHVSHGASPMERHEMGPHINRNKRTLSRQDRGSHVSQDAPTSRHQMDSYVNRDKMPMSRQVRDPHVSQDAPMERHEMGSHINRNKRTMSRQDRGSHLSQVALKSRREMGSYVNRDKLLVSRQDRNSHVSHGTSPMGRHEMGSHINRNKRTLSRQDRGSHVSQDTSMSRHEMGSHVNRNKRPGTSGTSLSAYGSLSIRKRKRKASFDNESVPEKKEKRETKPIGYKALENICTIEDENDSMLEVVKMEDRYIALLNSQEEIRNDLFKLVIKSMTIVIDSTNRKTSAHEILHSSYRQLLWTHFPKFIFQLPQMRYSSEDELEDVVLKVISIFEGLLQRFPKELFYQIQMLVDILSKKIHSLFQQGPARDFIVHRIVLLKGSKDPSQKELATEDTTDPPDDFRRMSIVPVEADFKERKPFVRANVINNAYRDTEHYLDVQFRLLREDFIMPLRERIQELRKAYHGRKDNTPPRQNTFLYQEIRIINSVCHCNGGVYRIQISTQVGRLKHVNWDKFTIKRLKFGALVCLSADSFNTLLFATVESRDPCDLEFGLLELRFENCDRQMMQDAIENQCVFQMIESEEYRHNLNTLQTMNEEKNVLCIAKERMPLPPTC